MKSDGTYGSSLMVNGESNNTEIENVIRIYGKENEEKRYQT